jgi:type II secretory ATPase GspE/PulE/Tfp pilus assembly ATPase PilB-like protein
MTGHLVLSTLHTNDAVTSLPRLYEMKIEPFLILILGSLILVFALGVFLPLWDLSRVALPR